MDLGPTEMESYHMGRSSARPTSKNITFQLDWQYTTTASTTVSIFMYQIYLVFLKATAALKLTDGQTASQITKQQQITFTTGNVGEMSCPK